MSGKEDQDSEDEAAAKNEEKEKDDEKSSEKGSSDDDSDNEKDVPQVSECTYILNYFKHFEYNIFLVYSFNVCACCFPSFCISLRDDNPTNFLDPERIRIRK